MVYVLPDGYTGVNRANLSASACLLTYSRIYVILRVALGDGAVRTLGQTSTTHDAVVINHKGHVLIASLFYALENIMIPCLPWGSVRDLCPKTI